MSLYDKFIQRYGRLPTENDPDYLEMLRMSKYRILAVPDAQPGKCANCGASKNDGRQYIDFGLHVDWYGAVHLCGSCLKDIADAMGLFNSLKSELEAAYLNLQKAENLQHQGVELHETIVKTYNDFEEFYVSLHSNGVDSSINTPPSVVDDAPSDVKSGTNKSESRSVKSTAVSGSKDVRSLADLLGDSSD